MWVPAFLIGVAFSSRDYKFWGKQSFSRILGNVTYLQDVGEPDEVSEIDDSYKQPKINPNFVRQVKQDVGRVASCALKDN